MTLRSLTLAALGAAVCLTGAERQLQVPGNQKQSLSLEKFNSILMTETTAEFAVRSLDSDSSESLWQRSMELAWLTAESREEEQARVRSRHAKRGTSSFVVCDTTIGKQGKKSKEEIASMLGDQMIPLYNRRDMSCFAIEALPSNVKKLPDHYHSIPMFPEMKLQHGLTDILADDKPIKGFQAMLCRESTSAYETIISSMRDTERRSLRQKDFLKSRATRHLERESMWHRHLKEADAASCEHFYSLVEVEMADESGQLVTFTLPDMELHYVPDACLYSIVVDLSLHPEVCFVGVLVNIEERNSIASGIVQGGKANTKLFYDVGLDGKGQVVAVSDSGLDVDHCYFWDGENTVPRDTSKTADMSVRKVVQYYAYSDSEERAGGHGTHVAATLAGHKAPDGRSEDDDGENGIARNAKIAMFDIGNAAYNILELPPNIFSVFQTGYDINARVHTASWGGETNFYTTLDQAVDAYIHSHPDFLLVVAAGNLGDLGLHTVGTPGIAKNALAVGATESTQPRIPLHMKGPDYLANFSSRGPTADGRIKPDICAPGIYLNSAKAIPTAQGECDDSGGLELRSGTSMAAPVVAGAATLVRQYFLEGWLEEGKRNPLKGFNPRASLLKAVLINGGQELLGVEDAPGVVSETRPYDAHQGFGRVELLKSLPIEGKNNFNAKIVNAQPIGNHGKDEYVLRIDKASGCEEQLRMTLVWTDPMVSPFCRECTVNDVDLYLTSTSSSERIYPNGLSQPDKLNNVERIVVDDPTEGETYTVHVEAKDLLGAQDYSLVITGCFLDVEEPVILPSCRDTDGDILVGGNDAKSCFWLARNFAEFGYLCELIKVASRCQQACGFCDKMVIPTSFNAPGPERYASVGFEGNFRWDGIMFDVQAEESLTITSLDMHTWIAVPYTIQVFTKMVDTEDWMKVCDTRIQGEGLGKSTQIPSDMFTPVKLGAGQRRSFHVTLDTPELVMEPSSSAVGDIIFSNSDIKIWQGSAVTYATGKSYPGYQMNGRLRYQHQSTVNVNQGSCKDKEVNILIDQFVGERSCSWLASNMDNYGHICNYVAQSTHCPKTCGVCYIVAP